MRAAAPRPARLLRAAAVGLLAGGTVLLTAGPVAAHTELVSTSPTADQALEAGPGALQLVFTAPVQRALSRVRLRGPDDREVPTGPLSSPAGAPDTVSVSVPALPAGPYSVTWSVLSRDGHPVRGAWAFTVRTPASTSPTTLQAPSPPPADVPTVLAAPPPPQVPEGGDGRVGALQLAARWAGFTGYALVIGVAAFLLLCWPAGRGHREVRRLTWTGWGVLVLATASSGLLLGPYSADLPLAAAVEPEVLSAALETRTGAGIVARAVLLALAVPVLLRVLRPTAGHRTSRWLAAAVLVLGAALAATWSATGHSGSGPGARIALPVDVVHLVAMAVWVGGLVGLLAGLTVRRRTQDLDGLLGVSTSFSRVAGTAVVLLVLTGSYQVWRQVGTTAALVETDYGRLLAAKLVAVALLLLLGAAARRWLLRQRRTVPHEGGTPRVTALRRSVLAEAGTAAVVLAMTAGLVGLQPARQAEVVPTAPTAPAGPAAPLDRSEYNEVDMIFVAAMAPHHAEGLWLTDTALRAGLPPAAASLAVQLRTHYQSDEPELEGLLAGFAAGADSGGGHGHGADGDDVPQGLTPAQQSALEAASGAAVERAFLELVVAHHVAGLASAASELRYGDHPPTVRLAERLRDASDRQLAEARALLDAVQTG